MTWTAPATAVTGNTLTAAFWNAQVRDNMLETAAATAASAGDIVYADAANSMGSRLAHPGTGRMLVSGPSNTWVARQPSEDIDFEDSNTSGTLTSTSYVTTANTGAGQSSFPSVTVTTGTLAKVTVSCAFGNNDTAGGSVWISFSISGATTLAAADARGGVVTQKEGSQTGSEGASFVRLLQPTAGSNTFQMEAKVSGVSGTGTVGSPRILVEPY